MRTRACRLRWTRNVAAGRLSFTTSTEQGVDHGDVVFIAVPTPRNPDGSVDLKFIEKVAREIAPCIKSYKVVVDKSTAPAKTGEKVAETIQRYAPEAEFDVVSNPEFLREGSAVADLMKPDRIVFGSNSDRASAVMKKVYEPFVTPPLVTDINSAELIKHAANSFLALKISHINAVSAICEASGADIELVAEGIGMDTRIGRVFLNAGLGYGGSWTSRPSSRSARISECLSTCSRKSRKSTASRSSDFSTAFGRLSGCSRKRRSRSGGFPSSRTPTTCAAPSPWNWSNTSSPKVRKSPPTIQKGWSGQRIFPSDRRSGWPIRPSRPPKAPRR